MPDKPRSRQASSRTKPSVGAGARRLSTHRKKIDRSGLANPHDLNLAPSRVPGWLQWGGMAAFIVLLAAAVWFLVADHWRRSTFALGVAMLWLAVLRLTCDSSTLGVFAVRSRRFDASFSAVAGAALMFLSASVDALGS
ncbi:DUF3017 domain-containing protein [Corynebacterium sp. MSK297]|uniref:DUF3017 domain-containing protein n=1 Tax=Corynebacterium sp. MSK297 TaxID=3050221 RepID=UPI003312FF32